jgi:hypothetical protein
MDQDLKQYLDANFARIDARFERIDERFAEVDRRAEALESRLEARIEKVETNLLGAFYGWARPMEIRVNGMTKTVMGFDERLALAEQRISELERKRPS